MARNTHSKIIAPTVSAPTGGVRAALIAATVLVGLYSAVASLALLGFPNSGDEYSYTLQAQIFASGKLSIPSVAPEIRDAFAVDHVIDNGRVMSKYPPGWPLLLTPGTFLKVPWLTNPVLGGIFAFLLFLVSRALGGARAGWLAMLGGGFSAFVVFQAGSLMSHMCVLCLTTLVLWLLVRSPTITSTPRLVAAGAVVGLAFLARPMDGIMVGLAFLGWFRPAEYKHLWRLALGAAPMALLFLAYNAIQFGGPLTIGYSVYKPTMLKLYGPQQPELALSNLAFFTTHMDWVVDLQDWLLPGILFLAPVGAYRLLVGESEVGRRVATYCLTLLALMLVASHFSVPFPGDTYGPRYLMLAVLPVVVLAAAGAEHLLQARLLPRAVVVSATVIALTLGLARINILAQRYHARVSAQLKLQRDVEAQKLGQAVVFLGQTLNHPSNWYTRNGIDFRGPLLFAIDRGQAANERVMAYYPGYRGLRYQWRTGAFKPLDQGP